MTPDEAARDTSAPAAVIHLTLDGLPVEGRSGQTLAGVLVAAGRTSWRRTRTGRPRGVLCGIGICHDCLITVNGLTDVRACQRRARDGDRLQTQDAQR